MGDAALAAVASKLSAWAADCAFPLWATAGFDAESGRFREALTLEGKPVVMMPTRLIVQARQVFSYAVAARRKWHDEAAAIVERGYRSMVRDYYRSDGKPGWVYSVSSDGAIADAKRDLYSHAFALLAISAYAGVTGRRDALELVDETLAFIDCELHAPASGGYLEAQPETTDVRRQNPHMHLFEAMLSLWENTGEARYLARAGEMYGLFSTRFFRPVPGVLSEYFEATLAPAAGAAGDIVEPGHHCEWIWLLRRFERETGRRVQPYIDVLYDHAARHGYDPAGLMVDEITTGGAHRLSSHRTWPMTEALKANIVEAAASRAGAGAKATALAHLLFDRFLKPAYRGGWMDRLDGSGQPAADTMPASTLYHLLGAIEVMVDFVSAPEETK
jgi:mannose/cellobiose epimerase-like protein (N-acyl-D-glucosamine 2-epimerase family)